MFVNDLATVDLNRVGPAFEHHATFPERVNVHFARIETENEIRMITWERGCGVTLACGTGASAVCVAGALTGRSGRAITARLPGGDLQIQWRKKDGHVLMTGPASEVFRGTIRL